jgi:hypothetical protein
VKLLWKLYKHVISSGEIAKSFGVIIEGITLKKSPKRILYIRENNCFRSAKGTKHKFKKLILALLKNVIFALAPLLFRTTIYSLL